MFKTNLSIQPNLRSTKSPIPLIERFFWKCVYRFFNPHKPFGRLVRRRCVKRRLPDYRFWDAVGHCIATFEHFDIQTDVLFLGSSHTLYGIAPKEFQTLRAWNAGFCSGDLKMAYYAYQTLRKMWEKCPGQAVVLSDDFWAVSNQAEFVPEFYVPLILTQFTDHRFDSSFRIKPHLKLVQKTIQAYRNTNTSLSQHIDERGFMFGNMPNERVRGLPDVIARIRRHCKMVHYKPSQLHYLERLKADILADGRRLVFLRFPVRDDYLEEVSNAGIDVWEPTNYLRVGCPVIDSFAVPQPEWAWADEDHFTDEGARAFTRTIEPQILEVLSKEMPEGGK